MADDGQIYHLASRGFGEGFFEVDYIASALSIHRDNHLVRFGGLAQRYLAEGINYQFSSHLAPWMRY
jgi:hypothetical protein